MAFHVLDYFITTFSDAATDSLDVFKYSILFEKVFFIPVINSSAQEGVRTFTFAKSNSIVSSGDKTENIYAFAKAKVVVHFGMHLGIESEFSVHMSSLLLDRETYLTF